MKIILRNTQKFTIITIRCLVVVALFAAVGCDKSETPPVINYPIEIPFTEYSLAGASCQWTNLNYDNKLIVINSKEDLGSYINCLEGNYPEIDFSKHTLLLAIGTTPNGIFEISNRLLQLSAIKYKLNIEILLGDTEGIENWYSALIVNKLSRESDSELVVITLKNW